MIASVMMRASAVLLLIGMLAGVVMGMRQDFALASAHAHLNLVGGVLLFMFGLYYRLVPAAGRLAMATVQGAMHIAGALLFPAGIALVILKGHSYEITAIAGSLVVIVAVALFVAIVFRTSRA